MSHRSPYAHHTCTAVTCDACEGSGRVTVTRSRWIGGSRDGYRSTWTGDVRCDDCLGYGEVYRSEIAPAAVEGPVPPAPAAITVAGYQLHAPGFTADSFDRAIGRAYSDGLRIGATDMPGMFTVTNPGTAVTYGTTRQTCTCKAGHSGYGCKHRAMLIMELDIIGMPEAAAAAA